LSKLGKLNNNYGNIASPPSSTLKVPFVWLLTDALNGAMAIPNLIGLIFLSGVMAKEVREYFSNPELLG